MNVISGRTYLNSTGLDPESGLLSSAKLKEKEKTGEPVQLTSQNEVIMIGKFCLLIPVPDSVLSLGRTGHSETVKQRPCYYEILKVQEEPVLRMRDQVYASFLKDVFQGSDSE
jgi:hypothetical protein